MRTRKQKPVPFTGDAAAYNTANAAIYIGASEGSLRISRSTGKLNGMDPPPHRKAGRLAIYLKKDLDAWLEKIPEYQSNADY